MDRLTKHDLVNTERHDILPCIATGTGIRHLIEKLQNGTAMHIARKISHVRRHQDSHIELVRGHIHGEQRFLYETVEGNEVA